MPGRRAALAALSAVVVATGSAGPAAAVPARRAAPGCSAPVTPPQPSKENPWAQQRYRPDRLAPLATGAGVTVGVVDSGVDDGHPQLRDNVLRGSDWLDSGGDGRRDCAGHGTAVASIIAAQVREGTPFHGLAPDARILPVRVSELQELDGKESGRTVTPARFAAAIRWAVDHGAEVINLSVVLYDDNPAVRAAVEHAVASDVVVVAAAGNMHDKGNPTSYPAAYDGVIGVGAIGVDGSRSRFSQTGPYVDLVAPGEGVLAATVGKGHEKVDGTSYAAPFVAATAALVRQYHPDLSAAEVAERIIATADPARGEGGEYGSGVLNPYRAVTETTAVRHPVSRAALPADRPDPAVVAREARRGRTVVMALWTAAVAGGLAGLALLLALVVPRGARRRWRPAD